LKAAFFVLRLVSVLKRGFACMFLEIAAKKKIGQGKIIGWRSLEYLGTWIVIML